MSWPKPNTSIQDLLQQMKATYDQMEYNKQMTIIREIELVSKDLYGCDIIWIGELYVDGTVIERWGKLDGKSELAVTQSPPNKGGAYLNNLIEKHKRDGYVENFI